MIKMISRMSSAASMLNASPPTIVLAPPIPGPSSRHEKTKANMILFMIPSLIGLVIQLYQNYSA
jgi:hypothetical protein